MHNCRGLRVRMGVHSGVAEADVKGADPQSRRTKYGGRALGTAKAMGDCGHGGTVTLSEACLAALARSPDRLVQLVHVIHLGDYAFGGAATSDAADALASSAVYAAVAPDMPARVPLLLSRPLRGVTQVRVSRRDFWAPAAAARDGQRGIHA